MPQAKPFMPVRRGCTVRKVDFWKSEIIFLSVFASLREIKIIMIPSKYILKNEPKNKEKAYEVIEGDQDRKKYPHRICR